MRGAPILFLVFVGACASGGAAPPAKAPAAASSVSANDDAWRDLTWEERHDVMTFTVLPNMGRLFQTFRHTASPDLACTTCHGQDAEDVAYRMPHGLPPLDPAHLPDERSRDPRVARTAVFMRDEVTPKMADLLGVPLFDPKTGRGFSCFSCHPKASP